MIYKIYANSSSNKTACLCLGYTIARLKRPSAIISSQYDLIGRAFYITYHKIHVFSPTFYHVGFCLLYFILGIILFKRECKLKRNKLMMKMTTKRHMKHSSTLLTSCFIISLNAIIMCLDIEIGIKSRTMSKNS